MPGPVGGGRSGGGGGIGGGARGGFSGGSHGGGFSSGSHSTFRSGVSRPAGSFYHMNSNNHDPEQEKKNRRKGIVFLVIFLAVMFGGPAVSMVGNVISDFSSPVSAPWAEIDSAVMVETDVWEDEYNGYYITPLEGERTKLDASLCTPIEEWYEDNAGLISFEYEGEELEAALKYFYDLTGVQPYLIILDNINGNYDPDWDLIDRYLTKRYVELFGEDEGHYIFLYYHYKDSSYTYWYIPGWDAMAVMDDNASCILMDFMEMYYSEAPSYSEMFSQAFISTAEYIMQAAEVDTSVVNTDPQTGMEVLSTAPPASTDPAVEADSSVTILAPVEELTSEPESVEAESTGTTVDVTYYEGIEPDTEMIWEEEITEYTEENYVSADVLKYIAGGFVILLAVILFAVYILWDKKKMRDLEEDM